MTFVLKIIVIHSNIVFVAASSIFLLTCFDFLQDQNDNYSRTTNVSDMVSPWVVSSDTVNTTSNKDTPIMRKSVITTQL